MNGYLVKCQPGSVEFDPVIGYQYPDVTNLVRTAPFDPDYPAEVWFMYSPVEPFTPKAGDELLGGWDRDNLNQEIIPPDPELFTSVRPIGNVLNEETSTFDGTSEFPVYHNGLGAPDRFWGSENQAPDNNQDRHIQCYRFITNWSGQDYHQVRFVLSPPYDKNNAPNALAILVYTDPARQNYYYTPGGFIWDDEAEEWYCETPLGQSPTTGPEEVYFCPALGSAPLNGGGTVPAFYNTDGSPELVTHNWDQNPGLLQRRTLGQAFPHFQTRFAWRNYSVWTPNGAMIINSPGWQAPLVLPLEPTLRGQATIPKPAWMDDEEYLNLLSALAMGAGLEADSAEP